jgi:small multidrug resistance pump
MKLTLRLAGIYNIIWGGLVILFPLKFFELFGMEAPNYPELWQCIGMIVGVYGVGYWIAAQDPLTHFPIVLVGFLGKVLGPIGFIQALVTNRFPLAFGINIIFNDLIWWIPFFIILQRKFKRDGTLLS